jgi:hypothetical protein
MRRLGPAFLASAGWAAGVEAAVIAPMASAAAAARFAGAMPACSCSTQARLALQAADAALVTRAPRRSRRCVPLPDGGRLPHRRPLTAALVRLLRRARAACAANLLAGESLVGIFSAADAGTCRGLRALDDTAYQYLLRRFDAIHRKLRQVAPARGRVLDRCSRRGSRRRGRPLAGVDRLAAIHNRTGRRRSGDPEPG